MTGPSVDSIISTEESGRRKAAMAAFRAISIVPERVRPKCHCLLRSRARPHDFIALGEGSIFSLYASAASVVDDAIYSPLTIPVVRGAALCSANSIVVHAVTRRELERMEDGWYMR